MPPFFVTNSHPVLVLNCWPGKRQGRKKTLMSVVNSDRMYVLQPHAVVWMFTWAVRRVNAFEFA